MWQTISQPLTGNVGDSPDAATFIIFYQEVFNEDKVRRTDHSQGYSTKNTKSTSIAWSGGQFEG